MTDIFREVDEDYQQERLLQFWSRHQKGIVALVALAIIGAAAIGFWTSHREAEAETQTALLAQAEDRARPLSPLDAVKVFDDVLPRLSGHRAITARLSAARIMALGGNTAEAVKRFDTLADDSSANQPERELALIESVGLQIDSGDPAQLSKRLDAVTADDKGFRYTAREWQALLAMRAGDLAKARDILTALANATDAPDGIHEQSAHMLALMPAPVTNTAVKP